VGQRCLNNIGDNMSSIEDTVCEKIQKRAELGKNKYGVTMERDDLKFLDWLVHLHEELMDATVYLQRIIEEEGGE